MTSKLLPVETPAPDIANSRQLPKHLVPVLSRWAPTAAGALLFAFLLSQVSWAELVQILRTGRTELVMAAVLLPLLATGIRVIRYHHFFPACGRTVELYGVFSLLRLINYALPFRSGELVALGLLKKRGLAPSVAETSPVWLVMRIADLAALLLWLAAVLGLSLVQPANEPGLMRLVLLLSGVSLLGLLAVPVVGRRLVSHSWIRRNGGWPARRLAAMEDGFSRLQGGATLVWTMVPALGIWLTNIGMAVCSLLAFGAPITALNAALAAVLVLAFNLLPIRAPLGLGTGDAAWSGALIMLGVGSTTAITLAVSVRLVQMLVVAIDGCLGVAIPAIQGARKG